MMNKRLKKLLLKSNKELKKERYSLLKEYFSLCMQKGTGQLKKHHIFKNIRHSIANINRILSLRNR